jgi:light-regulated signal transduction histidine kinase (bacteriophytochrome)
LEAFSYSVSHDLRGPLRAISGYSTILKEDYETKLDVEANRIIDVILNNAKLMSSLIDDLLSFSKMARLEVVNEAIDMKGLAEKCMAEFLQTEEQIKYSVSILCMPTCEGDSKMLKQVWYNLISNAIKYSSKKPNAQIEAGAIDNDEAYIYYVRDNGAGFDMKYAKKLFGVFQRLHRQEEFEGTGLGLALAKRIVSKHGGEIWAESTLNEGATFYFSIPKNVN